MSHDSEQKNGLTNGNMMPKQAQFIIDILKESGVKDYDPQVVHQLLEYSYAYCTERLKVSVNITLYCEYMCRFLFFLIVNWLHL